MQLRRQLFNLRKQPTESFTQYTATGTPLCNELAAMSMRIADTELCWNFLNGLLEKFNMIATLLEDGNQELELADVVCKLQEID